MGGAIELLLLRPGASSTAAEIAAAEQLVQLSGSTTGDEAAAAGRRGEAEEEEDRNSSSASPRSVGTRPHDPALALLQEGEEEETGHRRMAHRYRSLADLYTATKPIGDLGKERKRKRSGVFCGGGGRETRFENFETQVYLLPRNMEGVGNCIHICCVESPKELKCDK